MKDSKDLRDLIYKLTDHWLHPHELDQIQTLINEEVIAALEELEKQEIYRINGHDIIEESTIRVVPKKYIQARISELRGKK